MARTKKTARKGEFDIRRWLNLQADPCAGAPVEDNGPPGFAHGAGPSNRHGAGGYLSTSSSSQHPEQSESEEDPEERELVQLEEDPEEPKPMEEEDPEEQVPPPPVEEEPLPVEEEPLPVSVASNILHAQSPPHQEQPVDQPAPEAPTDLVPSVPEAPAALAEPVPPASEAPVDPPAEALAAASSDSAGSDSYRVPVYNVRTDGSEGKEPYTRLIELLQLLKIKTAPVFHTTRVPCNFGYVFTSTVEIYRGSRRISKHQGVTPRDTPSTAVADAALAAHFSLSHSQRDRLKLTVARHYP